MKGRPGLISDLLEAGASMSCGTHYSYINTKPYMKVTLKDYLKIMKESTCHCLKYNNKIATINRDDSRYFKMDPLHRIRIYFLPNWEIL